MSIASGQAAPLRFLVIAVAAWTAGRGAVIAGWEPAPQPRAAAAAEPIGPVPRPAVPPLLRAPGDLTRIAIALPEPQPARLRSFTLVTPTPARVAARHPALLTRTVGTTAAPIAVMQPIGGAAAPVPGIDAALPAAPSRRSRLSGSAWAFVRGGGHAASLSPVGQIGGGQAGARVLYRLAGTLSAAARVTRTIGGPDQTEAALGLDWQPVKGVPLHFTAERRIAIDRGGRNAWSLGAAGGAYDVRIAPGWRLDGYAQAGVVGAHARDLYGDGAVRAGRELRLGDGCSLTLGVGAWGAAQPRAERLDAGPTAVLRVPVAGRTIAAALDYRARVVGDARPHSGVAFTLGVDF